MNAFLEDEAIGRKKLKQLFETSPKISKYEFAEHEFDKVDAFSTGQTGRCTYEIKNRNILSTKYDTYLLELDKYNALMYEYTEEGYTPYYINFFSDGICIMWDVSKIDIEDRVELKYCTNKTAIGYKRGEKQKKVILLKPEEGNRFRYDQTRNNRGISKE